MLGVHADSNPDWLNRILIATVVPTVWLLKWGMWHVASPVTTRPYAYA